MTGRNHFPKRLCIGLSFVVVMSSTLMLSMVYTKDHEIFLDSAYNFLNLWHSSTKTDCSKRGNSSAIVETISEPFRATQIKSCGPFHHRIQIFNEELDRLRLEALKVRGSGNWTPLAPKEQIKLLWTVKDDFLQYLGNFTQLQMVMLPWDTTAGTGRNWSSFNDTSNLLIQNYYEWTADDPLCTWIETPGKNNWRYDVVYNRTCSRDIGKSAKPQSMKNLVLNAKPVNRGYYWPNKGNAYPDYFHSEQPPFAFYIYLIRDGIVNAFGDVYSGNLKLVQYGCSHDTNIDPPSDIDKIPLYEEIYSAAQKHGQHHYHRMIEVIPRMPISLEFLERNPHIKIHANENGGRTAELMRILGINKTRLIKGIVRAKLIYVPRASLCISPNIQEVQLISMRYRKYIEANFPLQPRNKLVLIRRSGRRRFTKQVEIEKFVESAAKAHNLSYVMFKDNPAPSLNDTMRMFHSAVMVLAPHGAGLANLVFSQPGTYVIEGVCHIPQLFLCFQRLAYLLGHHYHAIPSRAGGAKVVNITVESVENALSAYFDLM